jgi:hypothetical protein
VVHRLALIKLALQLGELLGGHGAILSQPARVPGSLARLAKVASGCLFFIQARLVIIIVHAELFFDRVQSFGDPVKSLL